MAKNKSFINNIFDRFDLDNEAVKENLKKSERVLDKARVEAEKIIEQATKKAEEMVNSTKDFQNKISLKSEKAIAMISQKHLEMLDNCLTEMEQKLEKISNKTLEETIKKIEVQREKRFNQGLELLDKEVTAYKESQYKIIDQKVTAEVTDLAMKVLGKSLSIREQQELIFAAIESAKKDGILK